VSSRDSTQASDVRVPGWKVTVAIGSAVVLAPVMGLVLLVLLAALLPVLPLLLALSVGLWWRGQRRPPGLTLARPSVVFRPTLGRHAAR
jgi:hypothetical protein